MLPSSLESLRRFYQRHVAGSPLEQQPETIVLDVGDGGADDSCQLVFGEPPFRCRTAGMEPGAKADILLEDLYRIPLADASVDIVVSNQGVAHSDFVWLLFKEMVRVLRPGGFIVLTLPSAGLMQRYPVDRYRFFPDACEALARYARCMLADSWDDDTTPWRDQVGVFRRADGPALAPAAHRQLQDQSEWNGQPGSGEEETVRGAAYYLHVLDRLQVQFAPAQYLEIGIRCGASLGLARGPATGVDPEPALDSVLAPTTKVVQQTSDAFFAGGAGGIAPDLCFIDGMHWFEYALRDFMNIERFAAPGALVVIDDVFPNHPRQAERQRQTRAWTGDVWRFVEVLRSYRPDLYLLPIDTSPTGLLLVAGLDPANRVLWDGYAAIVRNARTLGVTPPHVIERRDAVPPTSPILARVIETMKRARSERLPPQEIVALLRQGTVRQPRPAQAAPRISLIVIGYNMPRELPRTIQSLSPAMQRGINPQDYEVILIDNGSTRPTDIDHLRRLFPGLAAYRMQNPTVSPVPAINFGLSAARGDVVGVCIDGARMASPGLLSKALAASRLHDRPVIGTIAYHLGPSAQPNSIRHGYNEAVEDALLARSGWEADGYRLFSIASLAVSSAGGWFALPSESNAFFLRAEHWRALGGWDSRFVTPGGGFANADTWARACADPAASVIMLLGEATFHQVHGGVATNGLVSPIPQFQEEHVRLRGHRYQPPTREPVWFGALPGGLRDPSNPAGQPR